MKLKNLFIIFSLFIVLICCVSAISAVSDDAMNETVAAIDSIDESISVENDEQVIEVEDASVSNTNENDNDLLSIQKDEQKLSTPYSNITADNLTVEDDDVTVSNCTIGTLTVKSNRVTIFNNIINELIFNGTTIIAYNNTISGSITGAGADAHVYDNAANTISLNGTNAIVNGNKANSITLYGNYSVAYDNTAMSIYCYSVGAEIYNNTCDYGGIYVYAPNCTVYDNTCNYGAIGIQESNCTAYNNNLQTISVHGDKEGTVVHDNIIDSQLMLTGGYVGVNAIIYNNKIKTVYWGGVNSNNILFVNNTIEQFNELRSSHNITLINNTITRWFGIMRTIDNLTIINNSITHYDNRNGICIYTSRNVTVLNNYIFSTVGSTGFEQITYGNDAIYVTGDDITVENNYPLSPELTVTFTDVYISKRLRFNVNMNKDAKGTVEVMFNDETKTVSMNDGAGRISFYPQKAGEYSVTVRFNPDPNSIYGPQTITETVNVYKYDFDLNITVENAVLGENAVIKAIIPYTYDLDYKDFSNILLIVDGESQLVDLKYIWDDETDEEYYLAESAINNISVGTHSIVAIFEGSNNFNPLHAVKSFNLTKSTPIINVSRNNPVIGEDLVLNISVANVTGQVAVQFDDADEVFVDLVNGSANYTIEKIAAGKHYVAVVYKGDVANNGAVFTDSFTLDKTTPNVDVAIADLKLGEDATVTVTIANATGKVNIIVDGVESSVDLVDGVATTAISKVTSGTHTVVANYAGDDKNNAAYGSASKTLTVLSTEITDVNVDGDLNINAVLKDSNGKGIEGATILYKIGTQNATVTTGANGIFTIKGEENAKVEISYAGSDLLFPTTTVISLSDVAPTRVASEITASQLICYAVDTDAGEKGAMFKVTLSDALGKLANASVQFALNGKIYNATTDENGVASVQVNINKANTYTCAVSYLGDIKHDASFTAAKVVVNKKKTTLTAKAKTYKVKTKTKKYTATLKTIKGSSADGKTYLKAGKKVTITVNKKTYTAKTNSKGQVTFKITKLNKKGKYNAVIKFAGDNTYKAVTKKVKITVK